MLGDPEQVWTLPRRTELDSVLIRVPLYVQQVSNAEELLAEDTCHGLTECIREGDLLGPVKLDSQPRADEATPYSLSYVCRDERDSVQHFPEGRRAV